MGFKRVFAILSVIQVVASGAALQSHAEVFAESRLKTFLETNAKPQQQWVGSYGPRSSTRVVVMAPEITAYLETLRFLYFNLETMKAQRFNHLVFEYFPNSMVRLFTDLKNASRERRLEFVRGQMGTFYYNLTRFLMPTTQLTEEQQNIHANALLTVIDRAKALRMYVRFLNTDATVDPCLGLVQTRYRDDYQRAGKARQEYRDFMLGFELTDRAIVVGHPNNLVRRGSLPNNLVGQLHAVYPGQVFTVDVQVLRTRANLNSDITRLYQQTSAPAGGRNFIEYTRVDGYHNATLFLPESFASPLHIQTVP